MRKRFLAILATALSFCLAPAAGAQDPSGRGVPADVYYLMPEFGQGMIWFSNQGPAQGKLNICAEDNTIRFQDETGQEVVAASIGNVLKVMIDTVVFVRSDDVFYRICPITLNLGVGIRRDLDLMRDARQAAYGGYSRTSSVRQYSTYYGDGVGHSLAESKEYPYSVSETFYLYSGGELSPFNRKNLRKAFPERREDIDAYLKSRHSLPDALPDILSFLRRLNSGETL